jgi:hypothetical protein
MDWRRRVGLIVAVVLVAGGLLLLFYQPGGVTITWETASEVNTMGFILYRAEGSAEAPFKLINA